MKAELLFVVISLLLPPFAHAEFDPNSLTNLIIVDEKECSAEWYCVEVEKDGVKYLLVLESDRKTIDIIFRIEGKELYLEWGNWI